MLKKISTIAILIISSLALGQTKETPKNVGSISALAKLISYEGGSKIYFIRFKILKNLSDENLNDTVTVGYYFYKENKQKLDTVLLTLNRYEGISGIPNYYTCPDYDATIGIKRAKLSFISSDYWEGCETGKKECKPLTFRRDKNTQNWFLIMPCGGTETSISLIKEGQSNPIQKVNIDHSKCPPYFNLTELKDGKYFANMLACDLGGQIEFQIVTKNE